MSEVTNTTVYVHLQTIGPTERTGAKEWKTEHQTPTKVCDMCNVRAVPPFPLPPLPPVTKCCPVLPTSDHEVPWMDTFMLHYKPIVPSPLLTYTLDTCTPFLLMYMYMYTLDLPLPIWAVVHVGNTITIWWVMSHACRPEADDVHALQQQLSSLHLVMEQSSSEHEKQLLQVTEERKQAVREKTSLSEQLETLREEMKQLPRKEEMTK